MRIKGKEKKEITWKFNFELDHQEYDMLRKYGLNMIINDEDALINYAINYILRKQVDEAKKAIKKKGNI